MSELSSYCTFLSFKKKIEQEDIARLSEMLRIYEELVLYGMQVTSGNEETGDLEDLMIEIGNACLGCHNRVEALAEHGTIATKPDKRNI